MPPAPTAQLNEPVDGRYRGAESSQINLGASPKWTDSVVTFKLYCDAINLDALLPKRPSAPKAIGIERSNGEL